MISVYRNHKFRFSGANCVATSCYSEVNDLLSPLRNTVHSRDHADRLPHSNLDVVFSSSKDCC